MSVDGICEYARTTEDPDMSEAMCGVLVWIALVFIAEPLPAQQSAASAALPDCSWTTKTQWAQSEAQLVKPAGSSSGPIMADLIVRYDARKAWDHQDDVKACNADEACIKTANARRDARAEPKQRELAECDSLGSK